MNTIGARLQLRCDEPESGLGRRNEAGAGLLVDQWSYVMSTSDVIGEPPAASLRLVGFGPHGPQNM